MSEIKGKQLYRSREGRLVAGVCAGLGDYFGIDATIVRLIFVAFTVFAGMGLLLYVVAWLIIPEQGESSSIAEGLINKNKSEMGPPAQFSSGGAGPPAAASRGELSLPWPPRPGRRFSPGAAFQPGARYLSLRRPRRGRGPRRSRHRACASSAW